MGTGSEIKSYIVREGFTPYRSRRKSWLSSKHDNFSDILTGRNAPPS